MFSSLASAVSGMNASSVAMSVVGDNIANVNTPAFKSNASSFANVMYQSLEGGVGGEVGSGVSFEGTVPFWSQGAFESTSNPTDLAINGSGFFQLRHTDGTVAYSRAGGFTFDVNGNLVNSQGMFVQGYEIDRATGALQNIVDINAPGLTILQPNATTSLSMDINLDAAAATGDQFSTSISVYDSLGNALPLELTFTKQAAAGTWAAAASVSAAYAGTASTFAIGPLPPPALAPGATQTFVFNSAGAMTTPAYDAANPVTIELSLDNGATSPQNITWDLYDSGGTTLGDITGYSSESTKTFHTQDGYPTGILRKATVDEDGFVYGVYSNGQVEAFYRVVLADFPNYYGLSNVGNNNYLETLQSGQPLLGPPKTGKLGSINSSSLEMSNVDLATEFVKMITYQRSFQANTRVITTSDEMLTELINLKR